MLAEYGTAVAQGRARARRCRWPRAIRSRRSWPTGSSARRRGSRSGRTRRRSSCRTRARRARRPQPGEIFRQPDLARDAAKLVEAEQQALQGREEPQGGDLRRVRPLLQGRHRAGVRARRRRSRAASFTLEDLAKWKVRIEEPVKTTYRGIDVYKLDVWTQGPAMLQALNILEPMDLQGDGLQQRALHPRPLPGDEPGVRRPRLLLRRPGLPARRADARAAVEGVRRGAGSGRSTGRKNDPNAKPGDPYPFQGGTNPFADARCRSGRPPRADRSATRAGHDGERRATAFDDGFFARARRRSRRRTRRAGSSR